jgi:hypothetical protein
MNQNKREIENQVSKASENITEAKLQAQDAAH